MAKINPKTATAEGERGPTGVADFSMLKMAVVMVVGERNFKGAEP
jgi:hypothetical protein